VITGATGIVTKGLKYIWKQFHESIQQIFYKKKKKKKKKQCIRDITHNKESATT
jgi:NAD dependent epimerase/dehydratase family enzyme